MSRPEHARELGSGKRRELMKGAVRLSASGCLTYGEAAWSQSRARWRMPDEGDPHLRTWMAFGASAQVWGGALLPGVQKNLADLARTVARYEPVSMLVRPKERTLAQSLLQGAKVSLVDAAMDDLWIRDTGPSFVVNQVGPGERGGVQFNFNGWGKKQDFARDAGIAALVAGLAGVTLVSTSLVLEGGGIEVDGQGSAIICESCVLNDNRNPGMGKPDVEAELKRLLGLNHIIWLPGIKGKDITDGHTDFYARFARPGVVVAGYDPDPQSYDHEVTKAHLKILRAAKDAQGRSLEVVVLQAPDPDKLRGGLDSASFAAGYVGFYLCNGAVIAQKFGDANADSAARSRLQQAFPGRVVEQLQMDAVAAGGGSIHCATQQEPKGT